MAKAAKQRNDNVLTMPTVESPTTVAISQACPTATSPGAPLNCIAIEVVRTGTMLTTG